MIEDKYPLRLTGNDLEQILRQHRLQWEIMPHRGYVCYDMDYEHNRVIAVNPMDSNYGEVIIHEAVHFYLERYLKTGGSEDYVKNIAKDLVKDEQLSRQVYDYFSRNANKVPKSGYLV